MYDLQCKNEWFKESTKILKTYNIQGEKMYNTSTNGGGGQPQPRHQTARLLSSDPNPKRVIIVLF